MTAITNLFGNKYLTLFISNTHWQKPDATDLDRSMFTEELVCDYLKCKVQRERDSANGRDYGVNDLRGF